MIEWIVIGVLYVVGIGIFRMLGGLSSAGEAMRQWGRSRAGYREACGSSS
jgi:hypothetical protein